MGFTAVWISPVTHNIEDHTPYGQAYHGYWQDDLYSLNPHFGSESDLKALSSALHDRGMYLMVDVVANHFAFDGSSTTIDYEKYRPFNSSEYFHPFCQISNYDDQENVEECWLGDSKVELTDLNTTRPDVQALYNSWISDLVSKYNIDGLRIDTVKHVQKSFWKPFNDAAGVYCVGEALHGDPNYVCDYQNDMDGLMNYPLWYPLTRAFQSTSGSMTDLANEVNSIKATCGDSNLLGTFLENHDQPRFASLTSDMALTKNAIAFTILADGIPIIYQGQEQHYSGAVDPYNREAIWPSGYDTSSTLYNFIGTVNHIRNQAVYVDPSYTIWRAMPIYTDANTIAMRKGNNDAQVVGVFSNKGANGNAYTQKISGTGFTAGSTVVEILGCTKLTVASDGSINVQMGAGAPKIFYPAAKLAGSGMCSL